MISCDVNLRFWTGFTTFLIINFILSGFQTIRDGFLVDYFSTERHISGFMYGIAQALYGIGYGVALIASLTCHTLEIECEIKHQFLGSSLLLTVLSIFIGAGEFVRSNTCFITLDFFWRFLLGVVSFKNHLLATEMVDLWFAEKQELHLGVVMTVRYGGSAIFHSTGALVYVKHGYFLTFLVHAIVMIPVIISAFCFIADANELPPEACNQISEECEKLGDKEKKVVKQSLPSKATPTTPLIAGGTTETKLQKITYLLLIPLLTSVAPCGIYSVLITPYYQRTFNMSVDKASVLLTIMTATSAVSFTAVGCLLHLVSCFTILLVSCVLLILSPLLVFHVNSQVVSVAGVVMYGVGGPLGILSMVPCMEVTHCVAGKVQGVTVEVKNRINSLWLGVWTFGGNFFYILAGVAMDYLSFDDVAIGLSLVEVAGLASVLTVLLSHYCITVRS